MGWDSLVNIFNSIEMKKKKQKNLEPLAISEKDFKRPETLKIMSIFFENSQTNESMNENFFQVEAFSYAANGGHRLFTYIISIPN